MHASFISRALQVNEFHLQLRLTFLHEPFTTVLATALIFQFILYKSRAEYFNAVDAVVDMVLD